MKRFILFLLLLEVSLGLIYAQNTKVVVSGTVWDAGSNTPIEQATVQILSVPDSAYVGGNVSAPDGQFSLPAVKPGKYLLKVSYVGYASQYKPLQLEASQPKLSVGKISLSNDAILMKETVVTAEVSPVQMVEDTIVFNSSAYKLQEGALLEELVKKLPGAEVGDDGSIKVNGKTVKKILMKGKEFFGDNKDISMKNIPAEMVDKIKAYEKKSDMARVTGIDDGDEEMVLDLTVKKGMDKGWFGNADLGGGSKDRYSTKFMLNRFADGQQISAIGSLGNTGDPGFSRRGGGPRGGGGGLRTDKMGGLNFAFDSSKFEIGGNIDYRNNKNDTQSKSASETFLESGNSFSNSLSKNLSRSTNFNGEMRLEWRPDSMTNVIFRPQFTYGTSDSKSASNSVTFNDDPYRDGITDPLAQFDDASLSSIRVNSQNRLSQSESNTTTFKGTLQVNRKLNNLGRNLTFRGSVNYSDKTNEQISQSRIDYYQVEGRDQDINRFITTPTKNWNYMGQFTYSEPIIKNTFLQFSYKYQYKYSKSDRSTYNVGDFDFPILPQNYNDEANYDADQSKFAEYKNYIHDISLMMKMVRSKYNLNVGLTLMPQSSDMSYRKGSLDTLVTRHVTNFTPTLDFRYRFSKQTQLRVNYRGTTSQPSMTDLLDVTDNSNPLNITMGNPGLKPSFNNSFRVDFNTYNPERQQGIFSNISFDNTLNSISSKITYDPETGGRITRPENINGNWNMRGMFGLNASLPKNKKFTYSTFSSADYSNQVSYFSQGSRQSSEKSTTRGLRLGERLSGSYRADMFDVSLNGSINYNHSRNSLQQNSNQDVYEFSYGCDTNVHLPWSMTVSTSLSNSSRRGYSDASMNRNELIWNAQISQSFLKGNAATVMFQLYDILHNQSNISRTITSTMRNDTEYNSINSYCMLHFIYRLNLFGDKESRSRMRAMRRNGNFGGPFPGDFGGGRGGRGGGRGGHGFGGGF